MYESELIKEQFDSSWRVIDVYWPPSAASLHRSLAVCSWPARFTGNGIYVITRSSRVRGPGWKLASVKIPFPRNIRATVQNN